MSYINVNKNKIYYNESKGKEDIALFYIAGHRNILGYPPETLISEYCLSNDIPLIKFDYSGWGLSGGDKAREGYLQDWFEEALAVFDKTVLKYKKVILIGFSMGGLIALMLAKARYDKISGIFGISSGGGNSFKERLINIYGTTSLNVISKKDFEFVQLPGGFSVDSKLEFDFPLSYVHYSDDPWVSLDSLKYTISNITADISLMVIEGSNHVPQDKNLFEPIADKLTEFIVKVRSS